VSDDFSDYERRHPRSREFVLMLRKHGDADPDTLARTCIEALFDHLLNPPELDYHEPPSEAEALQVEAKLVGFVNAEAASVCSLIRRSGLPPDDPT
jgi:hypothetical protein